MSDDEEIVIRSENGLYAHLSELGYTDFESFKSNLVESKTLVEHNYNICTKQKCFTSWFYKAVNSNKPEISFCNHEKLLSILHSQLIFQEDVDEINTILSNISVQKSGFNLYFYPAAALAGLLSSAIALKRGVNIYFTITSLFTIYSTWQCYKVTKECFETQSLLFHIGTLQQLCSNIHKLLRYVKETEILSIGQESMFNVGHATYTPTTGGSKELESLPTWKTLPHLRRIALDSLVETIYILSFACETVKQMSPSWLGENNHVPPKEAFKSYDSLITSDRCVSLKDLQLLNSSYLAVQSEYLKLIALSLFPPFAWENGPNLNRKAKNKLVHLLTNVQTKVSDISFRLFMQYKIHNLPSAPTKSLLPNTIKKDKSKHAMGLKKISDMQVEVHNIFLLMLSVLLRVRSLEDYLENISEVDESTVSPSVLDVTKQLVTLKDDLNCAMKCFDTICHSITSQKKSEATSRDCLGADNKEKPTQLELKTTGIVVGKSDFNVNSPDEVFLAISGLSTEENENYLDDWFLDERKPQIPKNLLAELAITLKSRKIYFSERERVALEKKGLKDIESNSDMSEEEQCAEDDHLNNGSRKRHRLRLKRYMSYKPENSFSSDSEDENKKPYEKLETHINKTDHTIPESSVSSTDDESSRDIGADYNVNTSSLANLVARKSQLWGKTSEECYYDG